MTLSLSHPLQQHPVEPAPPAVTRRWQRSRVLLAVGALAYLTTLATLLAWSVLPAVLGWSGYVVQSGSMMPAMRSGDVLVSAPVDGAEPLHRGQIVVVDDPAQPGRLLSHRVARVRDDGFVITRGDANAHVDSTPVPPDAVQGRGRLLVPYIGLPQRWLLSGDYALLAGWLALTCLAVGAVATDPSRPQSPPRPRHRELRPRVRDGRRRAAPWAGSRRRLRVAVAVTATGLLVTGLVVAARDHGVSAAFRHLTDDTGNAFASRPDWVAPDADAVTVYKTTGYLTGSVRPSGPYRVYANVTDTGNPASGTASVRADMSQVTAGAGSTALNGGSSTVGGTTYNYSSAQLTAGSGTGTKDYSLTMADVAGLSRTRGYNVTVDGTAPTPANVDTTNRAGGVSNRPESGDTLTLTYSERIDPYSILSGWTGTAQTVTVRMVKRQSYNDITVVSSSGATLPLGTVTTAEDMINTTATLDFTGSTMTQTGNAVTFTLGTPSATAKTGERATSELTWTADSAAYDAAGNTLTINTVTEQGPADATF